MNKGRVQTTEGAQRAESKKSEVRGQRSEVKLISDLRLLTSLIDDFYDFYGLNGFNGLTHFKYNRGSSRLQL